MKPKHFLLALPLLCLAATARTQQIVYSAGINSGWFSLSSSNASKSSSISGAPLMRSQMMGPSKSTAAFSYEVNGSIQRISKSRFLYGAELAFQSMQSSVDIDYISPTLYSAALLRAEGKAKLRSKFVTLTPFAGVRIINRKVKMDLSTGLEFAACIERKEDLDARASATGEIYQTTNSLRNNIDYRIRFQLVTSINRIGLTAGYAEGLKNYYHSDDLLIAYSKFIRAGLTYRIN